MIDNISIEGKVNFAVIGCGHIGKRHIEMVHRNPESNLVAICDVKEKEDLNLPDYCGAVPFYNSLEALLSALLEIDVIVIATPNGYHAPQALSVLNAKKHVVVEKPMALRKQDAERIIFKSLQVQRQLFAVMQNRYSPPSVWIKELLEQETLGEIYSVHLNCFWNRDERYYNKDSWHGDLQLDGGTLFTQFSHFIDILYWLFGDIHRINARFKNNNHHELTDFEDSGVVVFDFVENGGMGTLQYSTSIWNQNFESSMTIIAENGTVKLGGQYMDKVEYCDIKGYTMPNLAPTNPGNDYGTYKGSAQNHHYVIQNVIDVLKGREIIKTNALEGMKVVDIIERIYESNALKVQRRKD